MPLGLTPVLDKCIYDTVCEHVCITHSLMALFHMMVYPERVKDSTFTMWMFPRSVPMYNHLLWKGRWQNVILKKIKGEGDKRDKKEGNPYWTDASPKKHFSISQIQTHNTLKDDETLFFFNGAWLWRSGFSLNNTISKNTSTSSFPKHADNVHHWALPLHLNVKQRLICYTMWHFQAEILCCCVWFKSECNSVYKEG